MSVTIDPRVRVDVLRWASSITPGSDAQDVTRTADPLLAWLAKAEDAADLELRHAAMRQHYLNVRAARGRSKAPADEDGNPDLFQFGAEILHLWLLAQVPDKEGTTR